MTAKRFTVDEGLENVLCWEINDKENEDMTCGECAKLLNELAEENEQLKKQWKEKRHEDINELSVIVMKYKALEKENEQLKFENNELKCALALDEVEYIIADGKKIDIPPYYEFEQRYDSVMHRREYDGHD